MIGLSLIGNSFRYELENVIMIFFPGEKVRENERGDVLNVTARSEENRLSVTVEKDGAEYADDCVGGENDELSLCRMLFVILRELTGIIPAWGMLTGVRPTKLLRNTIRQHGLSDALSIMRNQMFVSNNKLTLAYQTMKIQDERLGMLDENGYSLYISVPFCKSRCSYCSFVSHDVTRSAKLIPEYVRLLCREIEYTVKLANAHGLRLQAVYYGGGTPTALDDGMLGEIDAALRRVCDMSGVREYTVEAGRPDTITPRKLAEIRRMGADRISINPQTLSDRTLRAIGRNHTVAQFYDSFALARRIGFDNINTDLIAGLQGDTVESFMRSLEGVIALAPESITVHTLSVKRSSSDVYNGESRFRAEARDVEQMVEYSRSALLDAGYFPYYMYRQSRQAGNLENVGWSLPNFEGLYNMLIMEELQTVIAVGAGASSKAVCGANISRVFNYKYPYEYIGGFAEMLRRKDRLFEIIEEQRKNKQISKN